MNIDGQPYRTIWESPKEPGMIQIIDQRQLPFQFVVEDLQTVEDVAVAIADMHVRGAGCIGATAGYGMWLATREAAQASDPGASLVASAERLLETRPTAVNLRWAVTRQLEALKVLSPDKWVKESQNVARNIADEDADACTRIGQHGLKIIEKLAAKKPFVNVLTHCNAGWLAFVDYGSATAPIYAAHDAGIPVHVWVDETRPRNQGARLTAWELGQHGVPHTVIVDNAGGHLMQRGQVDMVITGTDRTTHTGDVANKIGTYLKALAAKDNEVPFYVALPSSTFDWEITDGFEIPIEERSPDEVTIMGGVAEGRADESDIRLTPEGSAAANPAFDVTPRHLITGLITERGICEANASAIAALFPEHAKKQD
jgi:methylthioribose-1-phosphate isomerase